MAIELHAPLPVEGLRGVLDCDAARVAAMRVRFTGAVLPGDTLRTGLWVDGEVVSMRTTAVERDAVVLDKGRVDLRPINDKEN